MSGVIVTITVSDWSRIYGATDRVIEVRTIDQKVGTTHTHSLQLTDEPLSFTRWFTDGCGFEFREYVLSEVAKK